ncbi:MAG: VIT1/CCC1 transporter family protein [Planctomycetaceae bacterium]
MNTETDLERLRADHTAMAIRRRLEAPTSHNYLRDFVYGGIDGAVTTFAIVSGVAGANLSSGVVLVLGMANLIGDGFSMAASNYLGSRAEMQLLEQARKTEENHIDRYPEGEREEIRQILAAKGLAGEVLEQAVASITADRQVWVDTMLREELGFSLDRPSPLRSAMVTFGAFLVVGFLPMFAFVMDYAVPAVSIPRPFLVSTVLTAGAFFVVGAIKSRFVSERWYWSGLETLIVGSMAAGIAWLIGYLLRGVV